MSEQITFRGSVVWSTELGGIGWEFRAGPIVEDAVELRAPLGTGHWVKPAGLTEAPMTLSASWLSAAPSTIAASLEALATADIGDLVVPGWGTLSNCRLRGVSDLETFRTDGAHYVVSSTLEFVRYP